MKKLLYLLFLYLVSFSIHGQVITGTAITSEKYFQNPAKYLNCLDQSKIKTGVLIDKSLYGNEVFQYNGNDQVKTSYKNEWLNNYYTFKYAFLDTSYLLTVENLNQIHDIYSKEQAVYPINYLDIEFNRIIESALVNQDFKEQNECLVDYHSTINSYSKHRYVSASVLQEYIYGDQINFILPKLLFMSNRANWDVQEIKVDFGNGAGFITVPMDEIFTISYNSSCEDVLVRIMVITKNLQNNNTDTVYSHFTFYRKGSSLIPLASAGSHLKSAVPEPTVTDYYPDGTPIVFTTCYSDRWNSTTRCISRTIVPQRKISYYILFNDLNKSGKLRRPFIICDGFDPNDTKDYYSNSSEIDPRGMYEILNGDPSKNEEYPDRQSAELVSKLQARGYDLVFVNFLDGAGDIPTNAEALRGFLNNVINAKYRDENTEEIILVGPSMGGLVTRYALCKMEANNEEHYVKQWISFDSPHKGANVSIGFQWLLKYFSLINSSTAISTVVAWMQPFFPNAENPLAKAKAKFTKLIGLMDLPAAKQMVLQHYSQIGSEDDIKNYGWNQTGSNLVVGPHPDFIKFYTEIESLNHGKGYPSIPRRYSISNGGTSKRYENDGEEIARFQFPNINWTGGSSYGNHNEEGTYQIFHGYRQDPLFESGHNDYDLYTNGQIGYENAPGGGYAMNGILNHLKDLDGKDQNGVSVPYDPQYNYFTFMPTSSVFGITVTRDNVYKTWEYYQSHNFTPFDKVFGMPTNEDHVQVTQNTADNILISSILEDDFQNSTIPYIRPSESNIQTVSGKVSFKAGNSITFAGNGNVFVVNNTAVVKIKAGNTIKFSPGFQIKNGAQFNAKIEPVSLNQQSLKLAEVKSKRIDYTKPLFFKGRIYDYSSKNENKELFESNSFMFTAFPNPLTDEVNISINPAFDLAKNACRYEIFDFNGKSLMNGVIYQSLSTLNLRNLVPGLYILKIYQGNDVYNQKIIKE